jgi:hypothetical protein
LNPETSFQHPSYLKGKGGIEGGKEGKVMNRGREKRRVEKRGMEGDDSQEREEL